MHILLYYICIVLNLARLELYYSGNPLAILELYKYQQINDPGRSWTGEVGKALVISGYL
jgi:hypothetical protein